MLHDALPISCNMWDLYGHSRKRKVKQGKYGSCKGAEGGKKHEQYYELDHQNQALDATACDDVKKYLKSCKKQNRLSQL